jgi:hypothetical protein
MLKTLFFNKNIIDNNTLVCEKHQNIVSRVLEIIPTKILFFVKVKLLYYPNKITNSINSEPELVHVEVCEAELNFVK